ncbi:MAG TPA: hypothetical protein VE178_07320 [Silvibacterium sp.]|nr:hypothetical protein [Silvibacterium sp.]
MHVVPAHAAGAAAQIAMHAMAGGSETGQLFDIQMKQVAGRGMLITLDRGARLEIADAAEPVGAGCGSPWLGLA